MKYSCKFRIYPNKEQEELIERTFGCVRYVYNRFLAERIEQYKQTGKSPSKFDQMKELPVMKSEFEWLKEVDSTALQAAAEHLDMAYKNFFRRLKQGGKPSYPKFKTKKDNHQSYRSKYSTGNIKILDGHIRLPKLGLVRCRGHRTIDGRILSATVSKAPSGKYFVAVCCTDVEIKPLPKAGRAVGLDMGIKSFAVTSDGLEFENHKYLNHSLAKLAKSQQRLSRKPKGSHNRDKARVKVARLHEHISNQRNDMLHKLSTKIVREYDIICIEDLAPSNMAKNHHLARSIVDASWREFRRQLEYKAAWYGKQVVVIDRFYPSSQICFDCGEKWPGTKDLKVRKWTCPHCGAVHDRDTNAAKNILKEGLRILAV